MSILNKYNKGIAFTNVKDKERTYIDFKGLVTLMGNEEFHVVRALYINDKSKFGEEPVIVLDDFFVNAPKHTLSMIKEMRQDNDVVQLINEGKVAFTIYSYENDFGTNYSMNWVEL